ncbi:MAG: metallophosphoesterase [Betaproteobacteria bacterium]
MPSPKFSQLLFATAILSATAAFADTPKPAPSAAQAAADVTASDGPYAFYRDGKPGLDVSWVCNGKTVKLSVAKAVGAIIKPACGFPKPITIRDVTSTFPTPVKFTAKKLVALSDVHGQFDAMVKLLQANGIIDGNLKWSFGDGHMVMVGDMFDRGPQVTEILWLLYQLEAEATAAGGALHVMLGNHETMVFYDDLRYVNPKYAAVTRQLNNTYPGLFNEQTVLGRWLRSKPLLLQVNDMLFVHGGLSPEFAALNMTSQETNEVFRATFGQSRTTIRTTQPATLLYGGRGPIWYRGYFNDPKIDSGDLDKLLTQFGVKRIVVGHTTMSGVFSHYEGRVISVDTAIQKGVGGELFIWTDGQLARGTFQGERLPVTAYPKGAGASDTH